MRLRLFLLLLLWVSFANAQLKKMPAAKLMQEMVHHSTLAEPGDHPFYLKATIAETKDPKSENNGTLEEYWVSPTKYRRVVTLRDFSQTRIVNGDKVFEENKGDYFPRVPETIVNEIVDPLPESVIAQFDKLNVQATVPGQREGQCMAEQYYKNADGNEERVLLSYFCQSGQLFYVTTPSCCYSVMSDYRKFHGKLIAYATKDNPITIRIDTLKDLDKADESLFVIAQPTPPEKRLATTHLRDSEARKLITTPTEIQWPAVSTRNTGQLQAYVVLDSQGKVRDLRVYGDGDDTIKNAASEAIHKWTFKPYVVDGVPTQVNAKLIIPFAAPAQAGATAANQPALQPLLEKVRRYSSLRVEGQPPFHLKASFHTVQNAGSGTYDVSGTYEETWISPEQWRREVKFNDSSLLEVKTDGAFYRVFPGKYASRIADDVIDSISFNLPGDNGASVTESDWRVEPAKLGDADFTSITSGYVNAQGRPDAQTRQYFVEKDTGSVRGRFHYMVFTVFNNLQPFANKRVARKLTVYDYGTEIEIAIDSLEALTTVDDSLFHLPDVKPLYTADTEDPGMNPARLVQQVKPSLAAWHGKAVCHLMVDEHGHVRQVEVEGTTDAGTIKAIASALMQWEYEPARFNGHPSLSPATVNVQ